MSATIIDGKATAQKIREEVAEGARQGIDRGLRPPGLATIQVGDNPASTVYVRNKNRACQEANFHAAKHHLSAETTQQELLDLVAQLNADDVIDGILCQLPLPDHINESKILEAIHPDKDVDGFHPINSGRLATGLPGFVPCTPLGCQQLLLRHGIKTEGAHVVVLGRSNIVGKPMALLMVQKAEGANSTVTICHSRTPNLPGQCSQADILIVAIGRPRFVTADFVKPGAAIIDVGINRIEDASTKSGFRLVGDVDFDAVAPIASAITPVPGGVGPMTIAMLLSNTLLSWKRRLGA